MKETVGSLQRYFGVVGILGGLGAAGGLPPIWNVLQNPEVVGMVKLMVILLGLCGLIQVVMCGAFLYFARVLPRLLRDRPGVIVKTIMASMGVSLVGFPITVYLAGGTGQSLAIFAVSLAISFYLMAQVKRLSKLAREETGPSPAA